MPKARYRFVRLQKTVAGWASNQRPSTDAINALLAWSQSVPGRSYVEVADDDASLIADLAWDERDTEAGAALEDACSRVGVVRSHVG